MSTPPPNDLAYAVPDPSAIADGERVRWEHEHLPPRDRDAIGVTASVSLAIVGVVVAGVASRLPPGGRTLPLVVVAGVGVAVASLVVRDRVRAAVASTLMRVTNQRLVRRASGKTIDLMLRDVRYARLTRPKKKAAKLLLHTAPTDKDSDGETNAWIVTTDELPAAEDDATPTRLTSLAVSGAIDRRRDDRRWRRGWRPVEAADTNAGMSRSDPTIDPPAAPLDGELVLWSGRPVLRLGPDLAWRLRRVAASLPWTLGAAAVLGVIVALDASTRVHFGLPLTIAGIVASLILIGQFFIHLFTPISTRRRLRRTTYLLTNRRLIVRRTAGRDAIEETFLFDDAATVSVELTSSGVGTVQFGGLTSIDSIVNANDVYAIALRAVAGARLDVAVPVADVAGSSTTSLTAPPSARSSGASTGDVAAIRSSAV